MRSLKCWAALLLATQLSCRSLPLPDELLLTLPDSVFSSLCTAFVQEEGYDSSTSTLVLRKTRPIFNTFALRLLHGEGKLTPVEAEIDDERDILLRARFVPAPVHLPQKTGQCSWAHPTGTDEEALASSQLLLELSNIVEDPFARSSESTHGIFARLSLGYQSGSWYWIALDRHGDTWNVSKVSGLEVSDG